MKTGEIIHHRKASGKANKLAFEQYRHIPILGSQPHFFEKLNHVSALESHGFA